MTCTEHDPLDAAAAEVWWPCREPSVEHADGTAECLGAGRCDLPHHLHEWVLSCDDLDPPCPCAGVGRSDPRGAGPRGFATAS